MSAEIDGDVMTLSTGKRVVCCGGLLVVNCGSEVLSSPRDCEISSLTNPELVEVATLMIGRWYRFARAHEAQGSFLCALEPKRG